MPKEVVVNAWCDPCYEDGDHTAAEEVTLAFGDLSRMRPRTLLLCERHRKEYYEPLRALADEHGALVGAETVAPAKTRQRSPRVKYGPFPEGEWECPVPDCDSTDLKDKVAVQRHMRIIHGVALGNYMTAGDGRQDGGAGAEERRHDGPSPEMPLRHIPETGVKMFCPFEDCNLGRGGKPSKNKRALSTHFTAQHGMAIGEWFRDHPEVDPDALIVRDDDAETLV